MIKTFDEAVKYLEKYVPIPSKKYPGSLGLDRMKYLMRLLGNPERDYPTIHVGGTSGKGSTSTIIASILATKNKVGLHTSPHLVKIMERIRVMQQCNNATMQQWDISESEFVDLINYIRPFVEQVGKSELGTPSYFEIVTAIAFLYFKAKKVDIAVIEVGMGGRFDATNVIKPMVAVLTNVGLDHTEILGDTVEKIAEDKAGIIKPGIRVVTGVKQASVIKIINARMQECENARMSLLDRDFSYHIKTVTEKGSIFDYQGDKLLQDLKLSLLGEYQIENASIAIRAVELLSAISSIPNFSDTPPISKSYNSGPISSALQKQSFIGRGRSSKLVSSDIKKGLNSAFITGRFEIVSRKPLVILDGAHNPDKMRAMVESVKTIFPNKKVRVIIAIKEDKNAKEMLEILLPICRELIFTGYKIKADQGIVKSYTPKKLLNLFLSIGITCKANVISDPKKSLDLAIKQVNPNDIILVTGSLYLVGVIKRNFKF